MTKGAAARYHLNLLLVSPQTTSVRTVDHNHASLNNSQASSHDFGRIAMRPFRHHGLAVGLSSLSYALWWRYANRIMEALAMICYSLLVQFSRSCLKGMFAENVDASFHLTKLAWSTYSVTELSRCICLVVSEYSMRNLSVNHEF